MPGERIVQRAKAAAVERRPRAAGTIARHPAAPTSSSERPLHQRLNNQAAPPLIARSASMLARATLVQISSPTDRAELEAEAAAKVVARSGAPGVTSTSGAAMGQLSVSHPDDAHEREADRVADVVMRMTVRGSPSTSPSTPRVQRACAHCEGEISTRERANQPVGAGDGTPVHRSASADGAMQVSEPVAASIHAMKGGGAPLPAATRALFEPRFGADFSRVRVHTGVRADSTAKAISAKAFTVGSDIAFAGGQYSPESHEGQHLLAHELTHVVQQDAGTRRLHRQPEGVDPGIVTATHAPTIQRAWYNFDIPFTDYQFDPSLEGVKTAAGVVKDAAVEGLKWIVDEITSLVDSGIQWVSAQWDRIKAFASSAFNAARNSFSNIISLITNPLGFLADAFMSLDAEMVDRVWKTFSGLVSTVANGFKAVTDDLLHGVNRIWGGINGFATSLLNRVTGLTNNFLFKKLPGALQQVAVGLVNRLKSFWKQINDGWNALFNQIKTWVDGALDVVFGFVRKVLRFGINVVIAGIIAFGKIVLFLKDFFANPQKYLAILAQRAVQAFSGVETRFAGIASQYFAGGKTAATPSARPPLKVQRQPESTPGVPETKRTATWSEIGNGVLDVMGKKWREFKANPLQLVMNLLLDLFLPIPGNVKDVIQLFKDIKKAVSAPLSAGSLQELWTSLLLILEIPRLIAHTLVGILMRTSALPLIVASFIPEPIVQTIATALGYALLGAFVQLETINLAHKLLLLKTGLTVTSQRDDACNSIADSLIALIMAGLMVLIVLLLKFIASVARGIINFIKGKVFTPEVKPTETKGPVSDEGKGGAGDGKGKGSPEEAKGIKSKAVEIDEPSLDGKRKVRTLEDGTCEVCASPCDTLRRKYATEIAKNSEFERRISEIESSADSKSNKAKRYRAVEQDLAEARKAEAVAREPQRLREAFADELADPANKDIKERLDAAERITDPEARQKALADIQSELANARHPTKAGAFHGPKPEYTNPGVHDPSSPNFRGGGDLTSILPDDAAAVYRNAVPDAGGKNWYGRNANGEFYRYAPNGGNDSGVHWNGRQNSARGLVVPSEVRGRF